MKLSSSGTLEEMVAGKSFGECRFAHIIKFLRTGNVEERHGKFWNKLQIFQDGMTASAGPKEGRGELQHCCVILEKSLVLSGTYIGDEYDVRDLIRLDLEKSGAHRTEMQVSVLTYPWGQTKIRAQLISFSLKGPVSKWAKTLKCAMETNEWDQQKRRGSWHICFQNTCWHRHLIAFLLPWWSQ